MQALIGGSMSEASGRFRRAISAKLGIRVGASAPLTKHLGNLTTHISPFDHLASGELIFDCSARLAVIYEAGEHFGTGPSPTEIRLNIRPGAFVHWAMSMLQTTGSQ